MTAPPPPGHWRTRFRWPARGAYVIILLLATLTPFQVDTDRATVAARLWRAFHPSMHGSDVIDGARNIVLFAGWGVVWALTSLGGLRRTIFRATLTGAVISAMVEVAQLFSANRNTSILDLATNTGGALAGSALLLLLILLLQQQRGRKSFVGVPALLFAGSYGLACWFEAVIPLFRQEPIPGLYGPPLQRLSGTLALFSWRSLVDIPLTDLPLFLPAGAFFTAALAEGGCSYGSAFRRTALAAGLLAPLAELVHGMISQPIIAGSALIHTGAIVLGAWGAARLLPGSTTALRGPARPRALLLLYVPVLACWAWRPFVPTLSLTTLGDQLASQWYIPLAGLSGRMDFFSVVDVCAPFFLYLPLGALLAVWPLRLAGALRGPLPGLWLSVLFEASQLFVVERTVDITDALIQASAVASGWALMRLAGYRPYGELWPRRTG